DFVVVIGGPLLGVQPGRRIGPKGHQNLVEAVFPLGEQGLQGGFGGLQILLVPKFSVGGVEDIGMSGSGILLGTDPIVLGLETAIIKISVAIIARQDRIGLLEPIGNGALDIFKIGVV